MKKIFTHLLLLVILAASSINLLNAQIPDGYYKKYHINQNFTGLEAIPSGWAIATTIFRSGGASVAEGVIKTSGSGSGSRGVDIVMPTPQANTIIGQPTDNVWYLEMDWIINGATLGSRNALGLLVSGSKSVNLTNATTYYMDGIFGLYVFGDGFLHYTNMDPAGPTKLSIDPAFTGDPLERFGTPLVSGQYPGFNRGATTAPVAATINTSTATTVTYAAGKSYHLTAVLNFATQKVVNLIIKDNADSLNTQTFGEMPFLAPTMGGTASTVALEQRVVTDLAVISGINTRGSNAGNGSNAALNVYYDNIQVYRPELSLGQADVTVNYKDRLGSTAKAARVIPSQEVSTIYSLLSTDKVGFIEGTDYYAYDADATHNANAGKGNNDGESVVVGTNSSLDVVFKKSPMTNGTYAWTGATGLNWSELEDNFGVAGVGGALSFQNGNGVVFSSVDATNKAIQVPANLNLGVGDFAVSAAGYTFGGTGRLEGTGSLLINAPTTIGIDNRLVGGAVINTAEPIQINHASAAPKYTTTLGNIYLKLNPGAAFTAPITGNGGVLNADFISEYAFSPAITKFSTVNINLANVGKATSNNWSNPITTVFSDSNVVINVKNISNQDSLPMTYAVAATSLAKVKVNLGNNTRLIFNGTPGANTTTSVKIGELSGTAGSSLEGNSVSGDLTRIIEYEVGGLNTDAVFNGRILPQLTKYPSRHVGTELFFESKTPGDTVWYIPSTLKLKKVGKGSLTVNGEMLFGGDITVLKGTLVLGNKVASSVTQIKVDTLAILVGKNIKAETGIAVNIATLAGSITANSISLTGSTLKMNVNSFAEGDYDKIVTVGDMSTIAAQRVTDLNILDITVNSANANDKIKLIEVLGSNADVTFDKILVNGEDIKANTLTTVGAKFVYTWDEVGLFGELTSLTTFTGLDQVSTDKVVKDVLYYNATGQLVGKDAQGFLIRKTIFTDGTKLIEKTIKFNR